MMTMNRSRRLLATIYQDWSKSKEVSAFRWMSSISVITLRPQEKGDLLFPVITTITTALPKPLLTPMQIPKQMLIPTQMLILTRRLITTRRLLSATITITMAIIIKLVVVTTMLILATPITKTMTVIVLTMTALISASTRIQIQIPSCYSP